MKDIRPEGPVTDPHVKSRVILPIMQEREEQVPHCRRDVCFKHNPESTGAYRCILSGCAQEGA